MPTEQVITPRLLREWPLPDPEGDKESRGTVLVVGGSRFNPGAVLLAGVAALRAGAGRLQLAVAEESAVALSIAVPEAKVVGLRSNELTGLAEAADVIAIGPGLDDIGQTRELMAALLGAAGAGPAVVLDAYALGALSKEPGLLRQDRAVLTPNVTEAGHLLGRDPGDDLTAAARALAGQYGAVVSLYGHIADPDGRVWHEESGPGTGRLLGRVRPRGERPAAEPAVRPDRFPGSRDRRRGGPHDRDGVAAGRRQLSVGSAGVLVNESIRGRPG
jgi:ADP-dependent NAD(P)H-hydrate dehydratase